MKITLKEIARLVGGRIVGDENTTITGFTAIEDATETSLTFLANVKYIKYLYETKAEAVLVNEDLVINHEVKTNIIFVKDSYAAFTQLLQIYSDTQTEKSGIEQPSYVSALAKTGKNLYVGAFSYIGDRARIGDNVRIFPQVYIGDDCILGDNCIVYPGVKIYPGTKIGNNCIFHSGCVIGADGFGFAPLPDGSYAKIPQTGDVVIYDNVEIGANTTIDRATLKSTIISEGVKLDNLIQIAHNVEIGKNTVIASLAGISGSAKIGERCVIAGQVGIVGHVSIANGSRIGAQSGVHRAITEENCVWSGAPVYLHKEATRLYIFEKNLPSLFKRVEELEKKIKKSGS